MRVVAGSPTVVKVVYITAGAAGMYCGSCMHDNTLAAALVRQGCDALLVPTYTPIRTDEQDVSQPRVFFGGINVYLQQKLRLFRHTPWFLDRLLDTPRLLRWVSRFAVKTRAEDLGGLTVSVLQGAHGRQAKELRKVVRWLSTEVRPQLVHITAALLSGTVHEIKHRLGVPVLCSLQGDDIYLDALPEPYRARCLELVRRHCREIDGFVATSAYYADFMAGYLDVPRERIHVVLPGLDLRGHGGPEAGPPGRPFTIGYFARICPEKGFHVLADAFRLLRKRPGSEECRLHVSGWLGENNRPYFHQVVRSLHEAGLGESFHHADSPDHASKVGFLQALDVLSVPTVYREPKGLYVLEALANGVPVVQPRHGSFPELVEATGGGLLVNPEDPAHLAETLHGLLLDPDQARELGRKGKEAVHAHFHADRMARQTLDVYRQYVP
jgi:glycosyltransferase involved in cell wall biosynthesis